MHRLLVPSEQLASDSPVLPKEAANHLKVLRPKDGEEIELFDGSGKSRRFSVEGGGKNFRLAALSPVCTAPRASRSLTLFACVTKGSRWDWTIEKATELGVTRIVPVVSARTIVRIGADEREAKRARWIRIAEDAARQSDAKWILRSGFRKSTSRFRSRSRCRLCVRPHALSVRLQTRRPSRCLRR